MHQHFYNQFIKYDDNQILIKNINVFSYKMMHGYIKLYDEMGLITILMNIFKLNVRCLFCDHRSFVRMMD